MNKVAMYKREIMKMAEESPIWFQEGDPIFGPALDYANELADPNMSEDDEARQSIRYNYATDAILNHPDLVKAIREQRLPEFLESAKNRSLIPQALVGGLGGFVGGTLAGKGITALSKGLGYRPIMLASQGLGALGGALGARHLASKGMDKLIKNLTEEQSGLTGTTKNMLDETMKNVRAEDEYKRVYRGGFFAELKRQEQLEKAIEKSENPIKLASHKDAIYKLAGIGSGIAGLVLGPSIGALAGGGIGALSGYVSTPRMSPEISDLHNKIKEQSIANKGLNYPNAYSYDVREMVEEELGKMDVKTFNNLKVKDVENIAKRIADNEFKKSNPLNKTASLKHFGIGAALTGIPAGISIGRSMFQDVKRNRSDKDYIQSKLDNKINYYNTQKDSLSKNKPTKEFYIQALGDKQGEIHPANYCDVSPAGCEGRAWYGQLTDNYLKSHNVNPKNMNWKDYNLLANTISGNILADNEDLLDIKKHPTQELLRIKRGELSGAPDSLDPMDLEDQLRNLGKTASHKDAIYKLAEQLTKEKTTIKVDLIKPSLSKMEKPETRLKKAESNLKKQPIRNFNTMGYRG